jgi:hypothetical protein
VVSPRAASELSTPSGSTPSHNSRPGLHHLCGSPTAATSSCCGSGDAHQVEVSNLPATLHTNACAIISLALALVLPVLLAAIIFGLIGSSQISRAERSGVRERGRALATWGIILGSLELVVIVYVIVRISQQTNCNSTFQNC